MTSKQGATMTANTEDTASQIRDVVVIGAGQMGSGIAQVFASAGRTVWLQDLAPDMLDKARASIAKSAGKLHTKGVLSDQQAADVESNIRFVEDLQQLAGEQVQLSVEAIVESLDIKQQLFRTLDELLPVEAVLASNTSSISITQLGAATARPERVVGLHFMNPPPVLELVEVVAGMETSPATVDLMLDLARDLGKTPVLAQDSPGFITNRVLMPMINEAFFCLHEGVGQAEAIDDAMRLGMRHPMGPLALADLIGLDTCLSILEVLHHDIGDDKYRPCPLLRRYVDAGRLGRKSGAGVYSYGDR